MVASSILVTGANRGIGLELVKQLASFGGSPKPGLIIAACRNPADAAELNQLSSSSPATKGGTEIAVIRLDVTDAASIEESYRAASTLCGGAGLNLIINNAGVFPAKYEPEKFGFESMTEAMKGNAVGPMILTKTFRPLLVKGAQAAAAAGGGGGSSSVMSTAKAAVVMMSSNLGSLANMENPTFPPTYPYYAYNASKAALNMVMKCLSLELAADGILVSSIHPGWVKTDMGGEMAPLTKEDSVAHMIATIAKMETGKFYNYDFAETGTYLRW